MEITAAQVSSSRSRSRSRTRNLTANSRSTSSSRRPSFSKRSLSSSSLTKLLLTTAIDFTTDRPVAHVHALLDNTLPFDFFKQELIGMIKALRVSKWHRRQLTVDSLSVVRLSGALTNSIYKVEYTDPLGAHAPLLLLRVYGKNVDSIIDRESELQTLVKLSAKRIGPRLLGTFTNGRFEQFLEGFTTMGKDEIRNPVISQMLGRRMKDLHNKIVLDEKDRMLEFPMAWIMIHKWMHHFESKLMASYTEKEVTEVFMLPWLRFRRLVFEYRDWLFSKYGELAENYRFCHNDTQYGNLLLRNTFNVEDTDPSGKRDRDLAVIDFEYSGANFPAYDIADHFSEWTSDYGDAKMSYFIHNDNYPNQQEQLNLLQLYVEYEFGERSLNLKTKTQEATVEFQTKKLYNEVVYWRATVQIFWCVWGMIQNGQPDAVDELGGALKEVGVTSTYNITTGVGAMDLQETQFEDAILSTDDDFDYAKYAQQKAALVLGDMILFGLLTIAEVDPKFHNVIKFLDTHTFDI